MLPSWIFRVFILFPHTHWKEVVARNYLVADRPDAIINIVDGTNIERNLYLSTQIMELGIPVIMAVNMMDIVAKNGDVIHIDKLSQKLAAKLLRFRSERNRNYKGSRKGRCSRTAEEESHTCTCVRIRG